MERRGVRIDEVGLTAKRATIGWPVEMPPRMPPAWLDRKTGLPSLPMRISSAFSSPVMRAASKPSPISTPLTALIDIRPDGDVLVELGVDRRAEAGRHAVGDDLDDRADRGAGLADAVEIVGEDRHGAGIGREEGVFRVVDEVPVPAARSIAFVPMATSAPRTTMPGTTLRASAPAATRAAVSRADERPPPRWSRTPYFTS